MTKLVLKRLTASDLTLFEWHYRNRPAGNQKAINLNADVFVGQLFPALPEVAQEVDGRFPVNLSLSGPGEYPELNLARKILKQEKNWRLDGETIHNPGSHPERFNVLEAGDLAVMEFNEGAFPIRLRIVFVAAQVAADEDIHAELTKRLGSKSMVVLSHHELSSAIDTSQVSETHPISELVVDADLEDAVQGGVEGTNRLRRRTSGRKILRSELLSAKRQAEENGHRGEEFVSNYLQQLVEAGEIRSFQWESMNNAVTPYDFTVTEMDGQVFYIDVKSTTGGCDRAIHISTAELLEMVHVDRYEVYRIYAMNGSTACLRVASNLKPVAESICHVLESMPNGVAVDGVSVKTDALQFGDEITLYMRGLDDDS